MFHAALWAGKIAGSSSKAIGMRGTSVPGFVARIFDWKILKRLGEEIDNVIVVTGTNGKTTTSNVLSSVFTEANFNVLDNNAGSNLITGIISSFINEADVLGHIHNCDIAVLEVDEASLTHVLKYISPQYVVVTNFFRDQLDRFGEIDSLIERVKDSIAPVDTKLILNADDPFSMRLASLGKETIYYGLNQNAFSFGDQEMSDSKYCECGKELIYNYTHYGQLGDYYCSCGFKRPELNHEISLVTDFDKVSVIYNGTLFDSNFKGAYNAYNLLAVLSCASEYDLQHKEIQQGILKFVPNNGRMERFSVGEFPYMLNLAKNPQGYNSTLSEFLKSKNDKQLVLFLNDFEADGKDPSWIWDADLEGISRGDVKRVICSGSRAYDMALRTNYAGVSKDKICVKPSIPEAINDAVSNPMETFLITNYTALEFVREVMEEHPKINVTYMEET